MLLPYPYETPYTPTVLPTVPYPYEPPYIPMLVPAVGAMDQSNPDYPKNLVEVRRVGQCDAGVPAEPREQKMLKRHLPRVMYHQVY